MIALQFGFCNPTNYCLLKAKSFEPKPTVIPHSEVFEAIEQVTGVKYESLASPKRYRQLSELRFIAFHILRLRTDYSLKQIGSLLNRDHSTVLYGIDMYSDLFQSDKSFIRLANKIKSAIN